MTGIQVVSIGEVLIEFTRAKDGRFNLSCDGDTFNTAVYLARAGINTAYATALGEDPYSDGLVSLAGVGQGVAVDGNERVECTTHRRTRCCATRSSCL